MSIIGIAKRSVTSDLVVGQQRRRIVHLNGIKMVNLSGSVPNDFVDTQLVAPQSLGAYRICTHKPALNFSLYIDETIWHKGAILA